MMVQALVVHAPLWVLLGLGFLVVFVALAYRRARDAVRLPAGSDDTPVTCPVCHGRGKLLLLPSAPGVYEICAYCNGAGTVPRSAFLEK